MRVIALSITGFRAHRSLISWWRRLAWIFVLFLFGTSWSRQEPFLCWLFYKSCLGAFKRDGENYYYKTLGNHQFLSIMVGGKPSDLKNLRLVKWCSVTYWVCTMYIIYPGSPRMVFRMFYVNVKDSRSYQPGQSLVFPWTFLESYFLWWIWMENFLMLDVKEHMSCCYFVGKNLFVGTSNVCGKSI